MSKSLYYTIFTEITEQFRGSLIIIIIIDFRKETRTCIKYLIELIPVDFTNTTHKNSNSIFFYTVLISRYVFNCNVT